MVARRRSLGCRCAHPSPKRRARSATEASYGFLPHAGPMPALWVVKAMAQSFAGAKAALPGGTGIVTGQLL